VGLFAFFGVHEANHEYSHLERQPHFHSSPAERRTDRKEMQLFDHLWLFLYFSLFFFLSSLFSRSFLWQLVRSRLLSFVHSLSLVCLCLSPFFLPSVYQSFFFPSLSFCSSLFVISSFRLLSDCSTSCTRMHSLSQCLLLNAFVRHFLYSISFHRPP